MGDVKSKECTALVDRAFEILEKMDALTEELNRVKNTLREKASSMGDDPVLFCGSSKEKTCRVTRTLLRQPVIVKDCALEFIPDHLQQYVTYEVRLRTGVLPQEVISELESFNVIRYIEHGSRRVNFQKLV
jgi:hypothetical protein